MIFNSTTYVEEASAEPDVDLVIKDPDTAEGQEAIAKEIEGNMQQAALENMTFFENGEQALREFCNSEEVQALMEARKMSKKTFVRLGKNDDLTRRRNMAALILSREARDPLFTKLAKNRIQERKIRNAIYKRYGNKAEKVARLSQRAHMKAMATQKALPAIKLN